MKPLLLLALFTAAVCGEVSQAEQDDIWAKAMDESAAIKAAQPFKAMAQTKHSAGVVIFPRAKAPERQVVAEPITQEQLDFVARYRLPWRPEKGASVAIKEIPENMRGKLLGADGAGFRIYGDITAGLITYSDGGGVVIDGADKYADGSISCFVAAQALKFGAKEAYMWIRISPSVPNYIILTTVIVWDGKGHDDAVWNTVYRLVK